MALKFKQYKNGIYGLKCGTHYIIPNATDDKICDVVDKNKTVVAQNFDSIEDAQWYVKYQDLSPKRKEIFNQLAKKAIWELSSVLEQCIRGDDVLGNPDDNDWLYKVVLDLRNRKKDLKPEIPGDNTSYQKLSVEKEVILQ